MNAFWASLRAIGIFTVVLGLAYPLSLYWLARSVFRNLAEGSLVEAQGKRVGSLLVAQKNENPAYFHPRPSAADFATVPSGASQAAPTSAALKDLIQKRQAEVGSKAPPELLLASGSGLDPHLSPQAALYQLERIAQARKWSPAQTQKMKQWVLSQVTPPTFGFLGQPRVNVLGLNLAMDSVEP